MRRRDVLGALLALAGPPAACAAGAVPGSSWVRSKDAWSAEATARIDAEAKALGSDAVLVVQRGSLAYTFGDIAKPMNLYSARKSVLAMLYGIHVGRGEIQLQATLAGLGITDKQGLSDTEKTATVRQLLQARSGVYHPAAYETAAMAAQRPARNSHAPGSFWYYNNWDFNALATVFRQRTGLTVFEALDTELAQPLQFEDFRVTEHTRFHFESASDHPAYLMFLSARDLARLGLLVARGGAWGDKSLVPTAWVDESTAASSEVAPGWWRYGYLWWSPARAMPFWTHQPGQVFLALGNFGQLMLVDRTRELVVVHRIDGSRWIKRNPELPELMPLLEAVFKALPT